jgi:assimilatory nitrate reductase catalytic subunit
VATLLERWGPHRNDAPPGGFEEQSRHPPDRLVKTHCCFCGQQCGTQLKVRDNQVVGFEPWEEFPFNRGMLCPKGVRRYLQNAHPDRLLAPLMRTDAGFREAGWEEALDFTAGRLREIQDRHGKDAVAVYGGASLTTEKAYLLGKFARLAVGTPTTTAGCAWYRRERRTSWPSASTGRRTPGTTSPTPRCSS